MSLVFINQSQETFTPTQSGAVATVIWELCRAAARVGVEPTVITRSSTAAAYDWGKTILVEYPRVPTGKVGVAMCRLARRANGWLHLRQRTWGQRVVRAIRERDLASLPLVLHNDPELAALLRSEFPGAFIVHLFHSYHPCKDRFRGRLGDAADVIAAVSGFTARWVESYYGLAAGRVQTLHLGVDAELFYPAAHDVAGPPVINYVGRTGSEKAPDLLLEAAKRMAVRGHKFRLQLIGSNHFDRFEMDDYQRRLAGLVAELEQLGIPVRRPGHVRRSELPAEFRKAHIHVVPSRCDEAFGLTTVEGMASGLAVVASDVGGTPEVIGDAGLLFERDDVAQLTARLERLLGDPATRARYGRAARSRAETFSWGRAWQQLQLLLSPQLVACTSVS